MNSLHAPNGIEICKHRIDKNDLCRIIVFNWLKWKKLSFFFNFPVSHFLRIVSVTTTSHVNAFLVTFFVPICHCILLLVFSRPSRSFPRLFTSFVLICPVWSIVARRRVRWRGDMLVAVKGSQLLELLPEGNFKHQGTEQARILSVRPSGRSRCDMRGRRGGWGWK
jgi:hypothetical protein